MASTYASGLQLAGRRRLVYHRPEDIRTASSSSNNSKSHTQNYLPPAISDGDDDESGMVGPPPRGFDPITLTVVSSTVDADDADDDTVTGRPSAEDSISECNTAHREPVARIYGVDYARLRELQVEPVAKQTALQETLIPQRVLDSNGGFLPTQPAVPTTTIPLPASIVPAGESTPGTQQTTAVAAEASATTTATPATTATFYDSTSSSISASTGDQPPVSMQPCPSTTQWSYSGFLMDPGSIPSLCGYCHGFVSRCVCPMLQNSGKFLTDPMAHDTWWPGKVVEQ